MVQYIVLLLLCNLFATSNPVYCDCGYEGSFIKVSKKMPLIALVKVTNYLTFKKIHGENVPMSMEVQIIDIYKGVENRKKIVVWGDDGFQCRPWLSTFSIGMNYIISFEKEDHINGKIVEKDFDYSIRSCGPHWLDVDMKNSIATGDINSTDRSKSSMPVEQLKMEIEMNCR